MFKHLLCIFDNNYKKTIIKDKDHGNTNSNKMGHRPYALRSTV